MRLLQFPSMTAGAFLLVGSWAMTWALAGASHSSSSPEDSGLAPVSHDSPDAKLSGRDIYERVLENRFSSYIQQSALRSGDQAGNTQETRLRMWFKSFREDGQEPTDDGLLSKTLVKYTHPFDLRHSGYLVINNLDRPSDQFVYLASRRRVQRVSLRGEAVFGSDFSFEDVIPKEIEDALYERRNDEVLDGVPCFVIDAMPNDQMNSEYSRIRIFIEKARYVPLLTRYWDDRKVEVKELKVEYDSIEKINAVWVPMRMTMRNLRHESFTDLIVDYVEPNPELKRTTCDLRRLEAH